jgi:hypothetical protein
MRRAGLLLVVFVAATAGLLIAASAGGSSAACKPAVKKVSGGTAHIFCSAKATVKASGKTYLLQNGECDLYPKYVVVRIGSVANRGSYLGLYLGNSPLMPATEPVAAKDGTYQKGVIVLATPKVLALLFDESDLKIVLTKHRRSGTFSGTNPADPRLKRPSVHVSGSFRC